MDRKIKREGSFWVYIVQCQDGTYYTGSTNDLEKRIDEHNNSRSRGAKYLKGKTPVKLVWCKRYRYYARVLQEERRIKQLSHTRKQELVKIYEKANQ